MEARLHLLRVLRTPRDASVVAMMESTDLGRAIPLAATGRQRGPHRRRPSGGGDDPEYPVALRALQAPPVGAGRARATAPAAIAMPAPLVLERRGTVAQCDGSRLPRGAA